MGEKDRKIDYILGLTLFRVNRSNRFIEPNSLPSLTRTFELR